MIFYLRFPSIPLIAASCNLLCRSGLEDSAPPALWASKSLNVNAPRSLSARESAFTISPLAYRPTYVSHDRIVLPVVEISLSGVAHALFFEVAEKIVEELTFAGRGPAPQLSINDLQAHVAQVSDLREAFSAISLCCVPCRDSKPFFGTTFIG
jgi:hypothetical protein